MTVIDFNINTKVSAKNISSFQNLLKSNEIFRGSTITLHLSILLHVSIVVSNEFKISYESKNEHLEEFYAYNTEGNIIEIPFENFVHFFTKKDISKYMLSESLKIYAPTTYKVN